MTRLHNLQQFERLTTVVNVVQLKAKASAKCVLLSPNVGVIHSGLNSPTPHMIKLKMIMNVK